VAVLRSLCPIFVVCIEILIHLIIESFTVNILIYINSVNCHEYPTLQIAVTDLKMINSELIFVS
jgi:hypothetical protein